MANAILYVLIPGSPGRAYPRTSPLLHVYPDFRPWKSDRKSVPSAVMVNQAVGYESPRDCLDLLTVVGGAYL